MAKGTYAGLQQIKPVQSQQGDIVSGWIEKYIAEGKAEKAAKLKELQEKNAKTEEFFRTVKIEPKDVEMKIADANQKLTTEVTNRIGELKLKAMNAKTDFERSKYMNEANMLSSNYRNYQTTLSSKQFIDGVKEAREYYESGKAFDQSEQARSFNAYANGMYDVRLTDDNNIETLVKTGDKLNDPPTPYTTSQIMELGTRKGEPNMLDPLYDEMAKTAKYYAELYENNPTGDKKTTVKQFVREKAELDFKSRYGEFDVRGQSNSTDYKQFGIRMMGKVPETEEEHNELKKLWVDKFSTYLPTVKKEIKETSDEDRIWKERMHAYRVQQDSINNAISLMNANNKAANATPPFTLAENAMVTGYSSKGTVDMSNAMMVETKKNTIIAFKVPNKNGKGFHTEYYNGGKDAYGRTVIDYTKRLGKGQAKTMLELGKVDFNSFDDRVMKQNSQILSDFKPGGQKALGQVKYDGAYKPASENDELTWDDLKKIQKITK